MVATATVVTAMARLLGEMLGGGMLSRIRSGPGGGTARQMLMARKGVESGSRGGSDRNPQQMELFMQKLKQTMVGGAGTGIGGVGVGAGLAGRGAWDGAAGAGLAYSRVDMLVDMKPNGFGMSRFNLGQLQGGGQPAEPAVDGGSSTGSLRNEEWKLL